MKAAWGGSVSSSVAHAGLQDHDATARRGVGRSLAQAEHVAVEAQRLVVVLRRHDEPELAHSLALFGCGHDMSNDVVWRKLSSPFVPGVVKPTPTPTPTAPPPVSHRRAGS